MLRIQKISHRIRFSKFRIWILLESNLLTSKNLRIYCQFLLLSFSFDVKGFYSEDYIIQEFLTKISLLSENLDMFRIRNTGFYLYIYYRCLRACSVMTRSLGRRSQRSCATPSSTTSSQSCTSQRRKRRRKRTNNQS